MLDGWKARRLEGTKFQGVLSLPLFPDTSTELSAAGAKRCVCLYSNDDPIWARRQKAGQGLVMIDDDDEDKNHPDM